MTAVAVRAIRVFAALFALGLLGGILEDVASGIPVESEVPTPACSTASAEPGGQRALPMLSSIRASLTATDVGARARLVVELPTDSPLLAELQRFAALPDLRRNDELHSFARACLATFEVDDIPAGFERITFERGNRGPHVRVVLTTEPISFTERGATPPRWAAVTVWSGWSRTAADSGVSASARRIGIQPGDQWPESLRAGSATWRDALAASNEEVRFHVWVPAPERGARELQLDRSFRKFIDDLPWNFHSVLSDLDGATPFVLMLLACVWIAEKASRGLRALGIVCGCFIAFYGATILIALLDVPLSWVEEMLTGKMGIEYAPMWAGREIARAALLALLLPLVFMRSRSALLLEPIPSVSGFWRAPGTAATNVVALLGGIAVVGTLTWLTLSARSVSEHGRLHDILVGDAHSWTTLGELIATATSFWSSPWLLLAIGLLLTTMWLCSEVVPGRRSVAAAVLLFVLIGFVSLADRFVWQGEPARTQTVAVLALPFALGMIFLCRRALHRAWIEREVPGKSATLLAIVVVAGALVYWLALPRSENEVLGSRLQGTLYPLVNLGVVAVLALALGSLRQMSPTLDRSASLRDMRMLASMLILAFLLWPSRGWLQLLVTLGIGALILRYWTFHSPPDDPGSGSRTTKALRGAIRAVLLRTYEHEGLAAYRKARAEKMSEGKLDLMEYSNGVATLEDQFDEQERNREDQMKSGLATLGWGPDLPPWERGLLGMKFGAVVGSPWVLLFVISSLQQPIGDRSAEVVSFVLAAFFSLVQWPLLGFVLLYFYPYIRGRTGLHKGLVFFASIAAPALAGFLVVGNPNTAEALPRFFLWVTQLFVACMVLGLVCGDYGVLRGANLGWRQLLTVHRFGSMAAWLSSVLVAIGAAIAAALSTQAVDWLAQGVQLFTQPQGAPGP
jgi:hypothetical protein